MSRSGEVVGDDQTWNGLVGRTRAAVSAVVPAALPVLVVADGFEPLLNHAGRRSGNFPQDALGRPAHHRLHNDQRAGWHVEALRAQGYGALVIPAPERWWLDLYPSLRTHLDSRYTTLWDDESCRIYDVRSLRPEGNELRPNTFLAVFEARHGRLPSILDWDTGADLAARLRDAPVVTVGATSQLDHIDQSIDLVVVGENQSRRALAEARRVATSAVAVLTGAATDPRLSPVWQSDLESRPPRAAIIVDLGTGLDDPVAYLRAVTDAVPAALVSDVIALSDAEIDIVAIDERVHIRGRPRGGLGDLLAIGEQSGAEVVVLLEALALPVDTCIAALVRTLTVNSGAAAVCGCLVDPIGFLRAAGGVLLADGDVIAFGDPGTDPFLPLYRHVRPVSVCPPPLLAIRVAALRQRPDLTRFESVEAQYAALSLALCHSGGGLLYQPEALVLDLRPKPGPRPIPPADREVLRAMWPSLLAAAPEGCEGLTWYDVAALART